VIARFGRDTALVRSFASEHKAKQLVDELRAEHRGHKGAAFWVTRRKPRFVSGWPDLQGKLLRGERPVPAVIPATSEDEDRVLARGGQVRRLRWVSV
jgi:hypothetical protein